MLGFTIQNSAPTSRQSILFPVAYLSDGDRFIPGLFEKMGERFNIPLRSELDVLLKGQITCLVVAFRAEAGQQGIPRGAAGRSGHIMMFEKPGGSGKRINTR